MPYSTVVAVAEKLALFRRPPMTHHAVHVMLLDIHTAPQIKQILELELHALHMVPKVGELFG
jgi:hypothetical protein